MKVSIPVCKCDIDVSRFENNFSTTLPKAAVDLKKKLAKIKVYPLHDILSDDQHSKDSQRIRQLIKEKPHTINLKDQKRKTPLHYAYKKDQNIKILLENGASPDENDGNGETVLHLYCRRQKTSSEIVKLIIEKANDGILKKMNKWNRTAFDIAKETGKTDLLHLLSSEYI